MGLAKPQQLVASSADFGETFSLMTLNFKMANAHSISGFSPKTSSIMQIIFMNSSTKGLRNIQENSFL